MKHLSERLVLRVHAQLINTFGGVHGLRDEGLLSSALAQPRMAFDGVLLHPDVVTAAAAYAFHLCRNHPFLDRNKRVAAVAMGTFLRLNGHSATFDEVDLYRAIMKVAGGDWDKATLTAWLRARSKPLDG